MPFKRKEFPYAFYCGVDYRSACNLNQASMDLSQDLDFMMVDLCHALNFRDEKTIESREIALTRSDTCVKTSNWAEFIVPKINSYMTDCDSKYEHIRKRSEAIINQEINLAIHLGCSTVVLDMPRSDNIFNFAAILNRFLQNCTLSQRFIIRVMLPSEEKHAEAVFSKWTALKQFCDSSPSLSVLLYLQSDLPSEQYMMRWWSEKVHAI